MDVFGHRTVRASRVHQCDYCRKHIRPGRFYERWACRIGKSVDAVRAHRACVRIADAVYDRHGVDTDERWVDSTPLEEASGEGEATVRAWLAGLDPDEIREGLARVFGAAGGGRR